MCFFSALQIGSPWSRIYPQALWPDTVEGTEALAVGSALRVWGPKEEKKEEASQRLSCKGNDSFPSQPGVQVSRFSLLWGEGDIV